MKPLKLIGTHKYPNVTLDAEAGLFEISGKSLPEDAKSFYDPILEWFSQYENNPNNTTQFIFKLDYLNTASSMMILAIFLKLSNIYENGKEVLVSWYSEEEDMKEAGIDYEEAFNVPFEHVEY